MTTFTKITAAALVAILTLNSASVSAQTARATSQTIQTRVCPGVHFPTATLETRAQGATVEACQVQAPSTRKGINEKGLSNRGTAVESASWSWGASNPTLRQSDVIGQVGPAVSNPVATAAPTTPEWPCGTVATSPNPEVVASSTSC
jgi:hypothetical protein